MGAGIETIFDLGIDDNDDSKENSEDQSKISEKKKFLYHFSY